jgi:hypothetical protein
MRQRNQAYSNLVELIFPTYIRLSIHAHRNSGPKFGINLFGRDTPIKVTEQLSPDGDLMSSRDLLHVPTPWHNCVVEVPGHPMLYVTKAKAVRDALSKGDFDGGLVGAEMGTLQEGRGRYFLLLGKDQKVTAEDDKKAAEVLVEQKVVETPMPHDCEKAAFSDVDSDMQHAVFGSLEPWSGPLASLAGIALLLAKLVRPSTWATFGRTMGLVAPLSPRWRLGVVQQP